MNRVSVIIMRYPLQRLRSLLKLKHLLLVVVFIMTCFVYMEPSYQNIDRNISESEDDQEVIFREFESNGVEQYPWQDDPDCGSYATRFGRNLNLTYLVSFPRSGNTWLRYLIEGSSGLFTSSIYNDVRHKQLGFLGELEPHDNGKTIVSKTHGKIFSNSWPFSTRMKEIQSETPVILLIRNPFKSLLSYWNLVDDGDKISSYFRTADISTFKTSKFRKFVDTSIDKWTKINADRLIWSKKLLILFYEDLRADPIGELTKVLRFLQLPIEEGRLECLRRNLDGPFKRKHVTEYDPFIRLDKIKMTYALSTVLSLAKTHGVKSFPKEYTYIVGNYSYV